MNPIHPEPAPEPDPDTGLYPDMDLDPDTVTTRAEFAAFVRYLRAHLLASLAAEAAASASPYGPYHGEWENPTLERFLEALSACAEDVPVAEPPSWRDFAQLLCAAHSYE